MPETREIIRMLRNKMGIREIHRITKTHRTVVREIKELCQQNGWLDPDSEIPREIELYRARYGNPPNSFRPHPLDKYHDDFKRWVKDKYTYVVMHQLIKDSYPCEESTVRRYVKRRFPSRTKPVIPRSTEPGKIMEVDFGYFGLVYDDLTCKRRKAWFFSGRLNHSKRAYREIVFDQKQETFFLCHIHAFEHFGGVPEKVVPDNLKAAIIKAAFDDPIVNRGYRQLAEHYDFLISPCLPRHPRHKGGVENDVKYVKRNFLPIFKEKMRRMGKDIACSWEMRQAFDKWNKEVAEVRIIRTAGKSPIEIFEEEAPELKPLPSERFDPVTWKQCKVGSDWRVQFDKAYYSVPYRLIGEDVMVCGNRASVYVFHNCEEVAMHSRAKKDWERLIRHEHAPPAYEEYLSTSRDGLLRRAAYIGNSVFLVAKAIIEDKVFDGLRPVRGLLNLAKKYSHDRLECACKRALYFETSSYRSVKSILANNLDSQPFDKDKKAKPQNFDFRFSREHGYFNTCN